MKSCLLSLRQFLGRSDVTVCLGLLVCICGLSEIVEEIIDGYQGVVGAEHGMLIFGIVTILKGLTELVSGVELVTIEIKEGELEKKESSPVTR
jgi:hypothetical protein